MPAAASRRERPRSGAPKSHEERALARKERYSDDEDYWEDEERRHHDRGHDRRHDDNGGSDNDDDDDDDSYSDYDYSDDATPSSSVSRSPDAHDSGERAIPLLATGRRRQVQPPPRGSNRAGRGRGRGIVNGLKYHRFGPLRFYRLPNRTGRYVGLVIIATITVLMLSLIRASQIENWKIVHGKIDKKPPPPHAWLSFRLLTRYYGGLDTIAVREDNVPEYPTIEDVTGDVPKKVASEAETEVVAEIQAAAADEGEKVAVSHRDTVTKRAGAVSKPFAEHPESLFSLDPEGNLKDGVECFLDSNNKVRVPPIRYYDGRPRGFPEHAIGSYSVLGLPEDICFERFGRFGPYGFGYSVRTGGLGTGQYGEKNGSEAVWSDHPVVDYRSVDWADIQQRCYRANAHRFRPLEPRPAGTSGWYIHDGLDSRVSGQEPEASTMPSLEASATPSSINGTLASKDAYFFRRGDDEPDTKKTYAKPDAITATQPHATTSTTPTLPSKPPRTALVIRVWDEYEWKEEDVMNIRSLIVELSMASSGRYDVHLLMQVRNDAEHPVWADSNAYKERINSTIPAEFRGLVTLWTQTQMLALYQGIHDDLPQGIPVHGPFRGLSMAMQYFAQQHPEYEYFWQWEMDARYTGHYLDLLGKLEGWAKQQPRKGIWERSERFYVPRVHGSWEEFKQMAKIQAEMGTATSPDQMWKDMNKKKPIGGGGGDSAADSANNDKLGLVWGPLRAPDEADWFEPENDPQPPTETYDGDDYNWGVGEEADLICLYPLYDPVGTNWMWADDLTGYRSDMARIPRRAHTIVMSRVSRRLLMTMHRETAHKKHFGFPEMWQATVALQHGYKAVAVPHPMFIDREWPFKFLAQTLNAGRNGASGGARTAVYGLRQHNVQGLSWYYNSFFAPLLYRRWLGLRVDDVGGESFETEVDLSRGGKHVDDMRGGEGRMCLPPMLIHPIKNLVLPVEAIPDEANAGASSSDPTA